MTPEELIQLFQQKVPNRKAFYIDIYKDQNRSFRIASTSIEKQQKAKKPQANGKRERGPRGVFAYHYLNPYTGEILGSTKSYEFFYVVAHIHAQLLAGKVGKTVVGIASIIFFTQLIGGLILWWPKKWNKSTKEAAFKIRSGTKWRRRNYDLHNVLGFYALIPALFLTITGLIMAYECLTNLTMKTFGGNPDAHALTEQYKPAYIPNQQALTYSDYITLNFTNFPEAKQLRMGIPDKDSNTVYTVKVARFIGLKSMYNGKEFHTNKYTGEPIKYPKDIEMHEVIEHTNFDLHVGYWGGQFGKLLTFLFGIICSSLPVTGFLIWWGRRKKKPKKKLVSNHT